ncbi:MAG: preprotein translocase subunit SecE [Candidatus Bipolaricaulia bacterium]
MTRYAREVRAEFDKISWPSRTETIGFTILVIAMVIVLTIIIFAYDAVFSRVIDAVLDLRQ